MTCQIRTITLVCDITPLSHTERDATALVLRYGFHLTIAGLCLIALSPKGIAYLAFVPHEDRQDGLSTLALRWPNATLREDSAATAPLALQLFGQKPLTVHLQGTPFQLSVWQALANTQPGTLSTYQDIAVAIGKPNAYRAVGSALNKNRVAVLIPCHRVIPKSGGLGGFRWGASVKEKLLQWEGIDINAISKSS